MRRLLSERYRERLAGVLSCYDRIIVTGTLPGVCYAKGMTAFLSARQIRIFDYPRFAEPLRNRVRDRAAELASAAGVTIEHIAKSHIRKEDVVAKVLAVRGDHPGLVHIISAMEACDSYKPWSWSVREYPSARQSAFAPWLRFYGRGRQLGGSTPQSPPASRRALRPVALRQCFLVRRPCRQCSTLSGISAYETDRVS